MTETLSPQTQEIYLRLQQFLLQQGAEYLLASSYQWKVAPSVLALPLEKEKTTKVLCLATDESTLAELKNKIRNLKFPNPQIPEKAIIIISADLSPKECTTFLKHLTIPIVLIHAKKKKFIGDIELAKHLSPLFVEKKQSEFEKIIPQEKISSQAGKWEEMLYGMELRQWTPYPIVTWLLFFALTLIFGYQLATGIQASIEDYHGFIQIGALFGPNVILQHEYWRFLSAMLVHAGLIHFILNGFALWYLGKFCERFYGSLSFLFLFLGSGLIASATSLTIQPLMATCGSSGINFGLLGSIGAAIILGKKKMSPRIRSRLIYGLGILLVLNGILGFIVSDIDQIAHLGGFIGGLIGGFCLFGEISKPYHRKRILGGFLFLGIALLIVSLSITQTASNQRVRHYDLIEYDWFTQKMEQKIQMLRLSQEQPNTSFSITKLLKQAQKMHSLSESSNIPKQFQSQIKSHYHSIINLLEAVKNQEKSLKLLKEEYLKQQKSYEKTVEIWLATLP